MATVFVTSFSSCDVRDEVTSSPIIKIIEVDTTIIVVVEQLGFKQIEVEMEKRLFQGNGAAELSFRVSEDNSNQQSREVWFVMNSLDLVSDPDNTALILAENTCQWSDGKAHPANIEGEDPKEAYFALRGYPSTYGCVMGVRVSECPDSDRNCHRDDAVRFRAYVNVEGNSVFHGDKIFDTQLGFPN